MNQRSDEEAGGGSLAGEWRPVSAELGGQTLPVSTFNNATLLLTAAEYEFLGDRGVYVARGPGRVREMDITGREGPNAGRTIRAIYTESQGRLTIAYELGDGARPGAFQSAPGSQVFLVRYTRVR